jgi:hypothetical protein
VLLKRYSLRLLNQLLHCRAALKSNLRRWTQPAPSFTALNPKDEGATASMTALEVETPQVASAEGNRAARGSGGRVRRESLCRMSYGAYFKVNQTRRLFKAVSGARGLGHALSPADRGECQLRLFFVGGIPCDPPASG